MKILLPEVTRWGVRSWGVDDVKRHLVIIIVWGAAGSAVFCTFIFCILLFVFCILKRHLVIIMVWGAAWSAAAASD